MQILKAVLLIGLAYYSASAAVASPLKPSPPSAPQRSSIENAAIFGEDERQDLPEHYSALEGKIGMIYEPVSQTSCTAFCVAPDIIATAAHCLFQSKADKAPATSSVNFRLDYGKVSMSSRLAGAQSGMEKNYVAVGTTRFNREPPLSAPLDWALARLERPVCRFGVLDVAVKTVPELAQAAVDRRIFQVAYHWDYMQWKLAYSGPCVVSRSFQNLQWRIIQQDFSDAEELVLHDCDTGGASSGSPILMDTPQGPVAVAINVGTYLRTRLLLRRQRVVKRLKPDIIANTAVNAKTFKHIIAELRAAEILETSDALNQLQVELKARGLYRGKLDGTLGRSTRSAIRTFEVNTGLPPTGLPTRKVLDLMARDRVRPSVDYSTVTGQRPKN